jgi:hypothetical protein
MKRTISVKAINVRPGDYLVNKGTSNQRVLSVTQFDRRCRAKGVDKAAWKGVLLVITHPKGYDIETRKLMGCERISIRRPNSRG